MSQILVIIQHTPLWVFPLIALVLFLGARSLRNRVYTAPRLVAFPAVLVAMSVSNLFSASVPPLILAAGAAALAMGATLGWLAAPAPLSVDRETGEIEVPGSVVPLLVVIAIVVLRYTFGYLFARYPELRADPVCLFELTAASALLTGVTVGRFASLGWRRRQALLAAGAPA